VRKPEAGETINGDIYRVVTRATARTAADGDGDDDGHQRRTGSTRADGPDDGDTPPLPDNDEEQQTWHDMQLIDTADIVTDIGRQTTANLSWEPPGSSVRRNLAQRTYDGGTDLRLRNSGLGHGHLDMSRRSIWVRGNCADAD